jgi:hypothetical protein
MKLGSGNSAMIFALIVTSREEVAALTGWETPMHDRITTMHRIAITTPDFFL